jgi:mono/diheme cytochrome c family protein
MNRPQWVFALSFAGALLTASHLRADDAGVVPTESVEHMSGEQIYTHICQGCHMPGGVGASGAGFYPKLAGDKKLSSWEYAAITVLNGRNAMPPFGVPSSGSGQFLATQLTDAQVADVVNYVRSHFDNKYKPSATAEKVKQLPHPASAAVPF